MGSVTEAREGDDDSEFPRIQSSGGTEDVNVVGREITNRTPTGLHTVYIGDIYSLRRVV